MGPPHEHRKTTKRPIMSLRRHPRKPAATTTSHFPAFVRSWDDVIKPSLSPSLHLSITNALLQPATKLRASERGILSPDSHRPLSLTKIYRKHLGICRIQLVSDCMAAIGNSRQHAQPNVLRASPDVGFFVFSMSLKCCVHRLVAVGGHLFDGDQSCINFE